MCLSNVYEILLQCFSPIILCLSLLFLHLQHYAETATDRPLWRCSPVQKSPSPSPLHPALQPSAVGVDRHTSSPPCPSLSPKPGGGLAPLPGLGWRREHALAPCRSLTRSPSVWGCPLERPASMCHADRRMARPIRARGLWALTACCGGAGDSWSRRTSSWPTRLIKYRARRKPAGRSGSKYKRDSESKDSF